MSAYQGYKITDFPDLGTLLGGEYFPVVYGINYKVTLDQIKAYVAASGVTGPGSAISGNLASFSGTTGKIIQDSGAALSSLAALNGATFTGPVVVPSLSSTGAVASTSQTAGVGYATGAGGTVTQITSKSTGVTLNRVCGSIVTSAASLASAAVVSFTVTNSAVAAGDVVMIMRRSGGTALAYFTFVDSVAAGSFVVSLQNVTGGALAEAVTLNFLIIKAVTA